MNNQRELETLFGQHGYTDFKWINPHEIVVSQWVRMKCTFGCRNYGKNASCPPNTPSVAECRQFISEYRTAALFHFEKKVDKPEDRHIWSSGVNQGLLKLERAVFLAGYEKAFLFFMDSCSICPDCTGKRTACKDPRASRPSPESMAVDVFSTVRKYGYPIEVLSEYDQAMNRYAFLFVE